MGDEQRNVDSARVAISVVPSTEGAEIPKALQTSLDVSDLGGDVTIDLPDDSDLASE